MQSHGGALRARGWHTPPAAGRAPARSWGHTAGPRRAAAGPAPPGHTVRGRGLRARLAWPAPGRSRRPRQPRAPAGSGAEARL